MPSFLRGLSYVVAGFSRLTDKRLRLFVLAPLAINLVLFSAAIAWLVNMLDRWTERLTGWLPDWLDWLQWLVWPLVGIAVILIMFYTFTMLANIIGAPLNGLLAGKVEESLGLESPDSGGSLLAEIPRAVAHEVFKWSYIVPRALPLLLLFLVPGINVVAPFLWFAFGAWMLAMEYVDYPMGNHGITFRQQRDALREHRMMALGFGCGVLAMTLIPILNFLSMPTAVIGATLMWAERIRGVDPAPRPS